MGSGFNSNVCVVSVKSPRLEWLKLERWTPTPLTVTQPAFSMSEATFCKQFQKPLASKNKSTEAENLFCKPIQVRSVSISIRGGKCICRHITVHRKSTGLSSNGKANFTFRLLKTLPGPIPLVVKLCLRKWYPLRTNLCCTYSWNVHYTCTMCIMYHSVHDVLSIAEPTGVSLPAVV